MSFVRDYLYPKEAATLLAVSVSSIRRYCEEGLLQCRVTAGGHRRISAEGVKLMLGGATANL